MNWKFSAWSCLIAASGAMSACTVGANYKPPRMALPAAYDVPGTQPAKQAATKPDLAPVNLAVWWRSLNDPELDSLVERAIRCNFNLRAALMRLQESRTEQYVVAGGVLPFVEASGAAGRGSGNNSTKGRIAPPLNSAANTTGLKEITQVVGFDSGWEIDLFGRFRRELEAAAADTQAAAEMRNSVLITVISDVAHAYIDLRTAQLRLAIANQNIASGEQTLDVVQQRFNRGLTNELDVALAKRQVDTEKASLGPLSEEIAEAQHRLAVLLGQTPESLDAELQKSVDLPAPAAKTITGIPADLLQRRPDIREAERQLAAQNARIGVATADLFPRLVLTAGMGLQGQGLGRVPVSNAFIWSVGPAASMPLFDFGRIDSNIMLQDFRTRELFYHYEQTVITAVEEVDNAAGSYAAQQDSLYQLDQAIDASKRAVTLANGRYDRGLIDFLNVLDAQRQLYTLEDQYTVARQSLLVQYIALYKALGGGWETYQNIPSIRNPRPAIIAAGEQILHPPHAPTPQP